ncbi:MAG: hypothetical protein U0793_15950 [Gemmataceae bacterium]
MRRRFMLTVALWLGAVGLAQAQPPGVVARPLDMPETGVSFIDSALPMSQIRVRWDEARGMNRPNRDDFFWPERGPGNRPFADLNVNYGELNSYVEWAPTECFSVFFEAPVRFVDPTINAYDAGFGDFNAGGKFAFCQNECSVVSGQFRVYIPMGVGERGLGNDHVTLEPALLWNQTICSWLRAESELRYWLPINGSANRGDILRYGAGLVFGCQDPDGFWITPVAEFVGWMPLSGRETYLTDTGLVVDEKARGHNIINGYFGARFGICDRIDAYAGYGLSLSSDRWYEEVWRLELRLKF